MKEARIRRLVDAGEKLFIVVLAFPFLLAFAKVMPTHPQLILVALSESLAVFFILFRNPGAALVAPLATLVALGGTALPLLVRPHGTALLPTAVTASLMFVGLGLSVLSKLYLNRSFGVLAANRGVKSAGPYRLVRHPMYLGYFVNQIGLLLAFFNPVNALIYAVAWLCQLRRVKEEERYLFEDPAYRDFSLRVRARILPGVY